MCCSPVTCLTQLVVIKKVKISVGESHIFLVSSMFQYEIAVFY